MARKLIFIICIFSVLDIMAQDCPCPTTLTEEFPLFICGDSQDVPCFQLDFDNTCVDTFYLTLDNPELQWVPLPLDQNSDELCVGVFPIDVFFFCEPLTTSIELTVECIDGGIFTQNIASYTVYPAKESFDLIILYNDAPCSGGPQFTPMTCAGERVFETIPPNDIICDLQDGMFIWTTYPSFDYTGAESCYEPFLTDTISLTPCPRSLTHGRLEIKPVDGNE